MKHTETLLDNVNSRLADNSDVAAAMQDLFEGLQRLRGELGHEGWRRFLSEVALIHPIRESIHEDPMCRRSFDKPRGYAGDAPLLDYIYGISQPDEASTLGQRIYAYAVDRPAAAAVRERRELIASRIDAVARNAGRPIRVLSIAAGHLREASLSVALADGSVAELIAIDSDSASLAAIDETFADLPIRTAELSVGRLMTGRVDLGTFDFVYSAGLYDYLPERTACRLTRTMFDLLEPSGELLFSNFHPSVADAGYMESYMGWELIYRDADAMRRLAAELPSESAVKLDVWCGLERAIIYLTASRRATEPN